MDDQNGEKKNALTNLAGLVWTWSTIRRVGELGILGLCILHSPEQVNFIVVEFDPVVSEPPGAALATNLPCLPYTS